MEKQVVPQNGNNKRRTHTLELIQSAIDDIKAEQSIVTKKKLMDATGLSSGTFSQPYVKKLLEKNKVCQYRETNIIAPSSQNNSRKQGMIELEKMIQQKESIIQDYELHIESLNKKIKKATDNYTKISAEYELLSGKYQQLLEYLDALGGDLSSIPMI